MSIVRTTTALQILLISFLASSVRADLPSIDEASLAQCPPKTEKQLTANQGQGDKVSLVVSCYSIQSGKLVRKSHVDPSSHAVTEPYELASLHSPLYSAYRAHFQSLSLADRATLPQPDRADLVLGLEHADKGRTILNLTGTDQGDVARGNSNLLQLIFDAQGKEIERYRSYRKGKATCQSLNSDSRATVVHCASSGDVVFDKGNKPQYSRTSEMACSDQATGSSLRTVRSVDVDGKVSVTQELNGRDVSKLSWASESEAEKALSREAGSELTALKAKAPAWVLWEACNQESGGPAAIADRIHAAFSALQSGSSSAHSTSAGAAAAKP